MESSWKQPSRGPNRARDINGLSFPTRCYGHSLLACKPHLHLLQCHHTIATKAIEPCADNCMLETTLYSDGILWERKFECPLCTESTCKDMRVVGHVIDPMAFQDPNQSELEVDEIPRSEHSGRKKKAGRKHKSLPNLTATSPNISQEAPNQNSEAVDEVQQDGILSTEVREFSSIDRLLMTPPPSDEPKPAESESMSDSEKRAAAIALMSIKKADVVTNTKAALNVDPAMNADVVMTTVRPKKRVVARRVQGEHSVGEGNDPGGFLRRVALGLRTRS